MSKSVLRGLTLASLLAALVVVPALAQDRDDDRRTRDRDRGNTGDTYYNYDRSSNAQFGLSHNPRWQRVRGTRVMVLRDQDRPNYDMFRYGRQYYVYQNGNWYRSNNWRGSFTQVDVQVVPMQDFQMVPRQYWVSYPSNWNDQQWNNNDQRHNRRHRDRYRDRNPGDQDNDRR